jgi:hypothetical protein
MNVVDIYGHIANKSELILGVGNYNNIHGLLTYFPSEDLLQMRSLPETITPSVIQLVLTYETPSIAEDNNRVYFSLAVKDTDKYINIRVEPNEDHKVACTCISPKKAFFWIDYSSIDKFPRSQILAGALYSLQTTFGEQNYVVSWKIQGFSNGDLVIFLPTTWYEPVNTKQYHHDVENSSYPTTRYNKVGSNYEMQQSWIHSGFFESTADSLNPQQILTENKSSKVCELKIGATTLVENLHRLGFKGYTTQKWCEDFSHVIHCTDNKQCGECLGHCDNPDHICYPDVNSSGKHFICGSSNNEQQSTQFHMVSFAETGTGTLGTTAVWITVIVIVIIVSLLSWGLSRQKLN